MLVDTPVCKDFKADADAMQGVANGIAAAMGNPQLDVAVVATCIPRLEEAPAAAPPAVAAAPPAVAAGGPPVATPAAKLRRLDATDDTKIRYKAYFSNPTEAE